MLKHFCEEVPKENQSERWEGVADPSGSELIWRIRNILSRLRTLARSVEDPMNPYPEFWSFLDPDPKVSYVKKFK